MLKDKLYALETAVNVGGSLLLKVLSHVSSPSHQRKAESPPFFMLATSQDRLRRITNH
jgi:hypothetical protein